MLKLPALMFAIVFAILLGMTQYLAYQQFKISAEKQHSELINEATAAKDRFRNILFNDIAAANTLAIIYKQYGVPAKFDSVARQIIQNSRYAEALQISENGIVRNVYPDANYKTTIGINVNTDPVRRIEEEKAIERKDIYFAGPRHLRFGDTGILGKVPVIINNKVAAVITVMTRLATIKKALGADSSNKRNFSYQLLKRQGRNTQAFSLSNTKSGKNQPVSLNIPEGDWLFNVDYNENSNTSSLSYELSGLGILFSIMGGLLAYRKTKEPYKLNKIITEKTEELAKSEKYFRTLIETSSDAIVLLDKNGQVLYQSPSTDKILGYTLAEAQQIDGLELIHPDDREEDNNIFNNEISVPGAIVQRSHRIKHKNGNYIYVDGTYRNLLNDENIKAIVYSYKDITEKVLAKQVLIESENRFRRAFEDSAIGMGLTSIEKNSMGKWLKVNRSLCEMLGYTEKELLALTFMQITHPDDLAKDLAAQDRILQGGSDTYRIEKRYIHKNGSVVWINLNVSIIRDKDKQPIYLVAQVENITDKVESQIKFQNLVENFIVGVYILQNNKIVYVNPRVLEETGYSSDEVINMPVELFIYPEDRKMINDIIATRTKDGLDNIRYEARILRKDETPIWYEILGSSTLYQGAPALIGTTVNITERKAIYEELTWSEANLRSIFNTTNVSYLLLDANYNIISLNGQMKETYLNIAGIDLIEGANLVELILPEKRSAAKEIYDRVVQTNQSIDYETSYIKDGVDKYFLANVKPINDGQKVIGICISAIDITKQKELTNDLLNHVKAIEEQNKKLREIAWIQSHVVRAPLARLMGLINLFNNNENNEAEARQILQYVIISANELDEVIKEITEKVYD